MTAIMVDIETVDVKPSAAIVSIGAVAFDKRAKNTHEEMLENSFNVNISFESNEKAGRTFSASTIAWWLKQSKEAQASLFREPVMPLQKALTEYRMWCEKQNADRYYANDPDFDIVILNNALESMNDRSPFGYYQHRSLRTTIEDAYPDEPMPNVAPGTAHDARDDAIKQALIVQHCYHHLHSK